MGAQSGGNVAVGCKLPHGLHLDVYDENGQFDRSKRVTLKGMNQRSEGQECGITLVDKDYYEAWKKQHKQLPALKNGAIFECNSIIEVANEGRSRAKVKTGFEGIDPQNPGASVKGVEKGEADKPNA